MSKQLVSCICLHYYIFFPKVVILDKYLFSVVCTLSFHVKHSSINYTVKPPLSEHQLSEYPNIRTLYPPCYFQVTDVFTRFKYLHTKHEINKVIHTL